MMVQPGIPARLWRSTFLRVAAGSSARVRQNGFARISSASRYVVITCATGMPDERHQRKNRPFAATIRSASDSLRTGMVATDRSRWPRCRSMAMAAALIVPTPMFMHDSLPKSPTLSMGQVAGLRREPLPGKSRRAMKTALLGPRADGGRAPAARPQAEAPAERQRVRRADAGHPASEAERQHRDVHLVARAGVDVGGLRATRAS